MNIQIRESKTGAVLAHGEQPADVVSYEGNLYFDPASVNRSALEITERTYTCPHKGTCNWVDFVGEGGGRVRDVAWVYPEVKPGHELIQGRFGFYAGNRGSTRRKDLEDCSDDSSSSTFPNLNSFQRAGGLGVQSY